MKKLIFIMMLLYSTSVFAAPDKTITTPNSFSANTKIKSAEVNENFNEVSSEFNTHDHTDITQVGAITTGSWLGTEVGTQYGGTGANFVTATAGQLLYFSSTGVLSKVPTGTVGYFLSSNNTGIPTWNVGGSADHQITKGFQVDGGGVSTVAVMEGNLFHGSTQISTSASTTLTFATADDWWDGGVDGSAHTYSVDDWCYVGVASSGAIKLMATSAADVLDISGNTDTNGVNLYYASSSGAGTDYWRIIGAVPLNTSEQIASKSVQIGDFVYYAASQAAVTAVNATSFTALDLSARIPAFSEQVNLHVFANNGQPNHTSFKLSINSLDTFAAVTASDITNWNDLNLKMPALGQTIWYKSDTSDLYGTIHVTGYYVGNIR